MNHEEGELQIRCVKWFRIQYPHYAKLLYHVKNEEAGGRTAGAIHKAEGVVKGVPDLMLSVPAKYGKVVYHSFGIEMKTEKGVQKPHQKDFQKMFEASGNFYFVVRSLEEFMNRVNEWMQHVPKGYERSVMDASKEIAQDELEQERNKLGRLIRSRRAISPIRTIKSITK